MDQRLVLVYLRACTMAQTCMSCVGVRCITSGTRRRQMLLARCRRPAYRNSWAGMTRGASTGLARNHVAAPGPDWLRCLTFAHSRFSLSPNTVDLFSEFFLGFGGVGDLSVVCC